MWRQLAKRNRTAALSIRWGLMAFLALLVVGYCVTYFQQQQSIDAAQQRIDELNATLDELKLTSAALQSDLAFGQTDAYIERVAREELGYVRRGEIKFIEAEDEEAEDALQNSSEQSSSESEEEGTPEQTQEPGED